MRGVRDLLGQGWPSASLSDPAIEFGDVTLAPVAFRLAMIAGLVVCFSPDGTSPVLGLAAEHLPAGLH